MTFQHRRGDAPIPSAARASGYPAAQVSFELGFVPSSAGPALRDVYPLFLSAECDESLFVIPPRSTTVKSPCRPFRIPVEGRMVLLASHAHRYATEILLTLNGKELWRTSPIHLPDGTNLGNPLYGGRRSELAPLDAAILLLTGAADRRYLRHAQPGRILSAERDDPTRVEAIQPTMTSLIPGRADTG